MCTCERLEKPRVRVISNVSMIADLSGRMLFAPQNKLEIADRWHIPSMPGVGFGDFNVSKFQKEAALPMGHIHRTHRESLRRYCFMDVHHCNIKRDTKKGEEGRGGVTPKRVGSIPSPSASVGTLWTGREEKGNKEGRA